jgi:hypothetical protein
LISNSPAGSEGEIEVNVAPPLKRIKADTSEAAEARAAIEPMDAQHLFMPAPHLQEETEEELFCRSISKALTRLSPRSRRMARIRIEQVLLDMEFPGQNSDVHSNTKHP